MQTLSLQYEVNLSPAALIEKLLLEFKPKKKLHKRVFQFSSFDSNSLVFIEESVSANGFRFEKESLEAKGSNIKAGYRVAGQVEIKKSEFGSRMNVIFFSPLGEVFMWVCLTFIVLMGIISFPLIFVIEIKAKLFFLLPYALLGIVWTLRKSGVDFYIRESRTVQDFFDQKLRQYQYSL